MVIDFTYGAINQFNNTVFPIWNWSTRPIPVMVVVGLDAALKEGTVNTFGKDGDHSTILKESTVNVIKVG